MPPPWSRGFVWPVRVVGADQPLLGGFQPVIGGGEQEINNGYYFRYTWTVYPLGDDDSLDLLILTGEYEAHIVLTATAGGDAVLAFYEDTTYSETGPETTPENANRRVHGVINNTTKLYRAATLISPGDNLWSIFLPGGSGGLALGAEGGMRGKWLLDPEASGTPRAYLAQLTNVSGLNRYVTLQVEWSEPRS